MDQSIIEEEEDATQLLPPVAIQMLTILVTMILMLIGLVQLQQVTSSADSKTLWLPDRHMEPSKYAYEYYSLIYTPVWICIFGYIVVSGIYETFDKWSYMKVCVGLALPLLLQPFVYNTCQYEKQRYWYKRYSFKANVWIGTFSFIGNYWYTHYFYSVLKAKYTMPSHRLNNVPIALYFATHFYFTTYHVFSNIMLRVITTRYQFTYVRTLLKWTSIICFSYFTAFMETLTISSFPYYSFDNRDMAYTVGSAFYGIYFLISFPMFYEFDVSIDDDNNNNNSNDASKNQKKQKTPTVWETFVHSCGCGMIVLCLLDFVRLYLNIPLTVDIAST